MANETLTYYESATYRLSRDVVENSDMPLREIVQLVCKWVMLELEERPPKKTTAAGTAGDALCAGDGTGRDGEADGDGGRGIDDEGS